MDDGHVRRGRLHQSQEPQLDEQQDQCRFRRRVGEKDYRAFDRSGFRLDCGTHRRSGACAGNLNGLESPYFNLKVLNTAEEAREWTRKVLALGGDGVFFQNGRAKDEVVRTAFEEGHKAGKPGFIRATGPEIFPRKAADLGADAIPLSMGISEEVASDSMPPVPDPNLQRPVVKPGEIPPFIVPPPDDLDLWAYMDDVPSRLSLRSSG